MTTIRSDRVVLDGDTRPATIRYEDGRIVDIGNGSADSDFGDLVILPGLVDSHVHVNEPGRTEWEGFATATQAAAAGGTTTIVDMPLNSIPPTTSVEALHVKRYAAGGKISVDVGFWGGLIPGSLPDLAPLAGEGVSGFKSFLVDSGVPEFPAISGEELREGLRKMAGLGIPSILHAEDPAMLFPIAGDPRSYREYAESRPAEGEGRAVAMVTGLARETGARVHILHVSSGEAIDAISEGPEEVSGETCPHYLVFCADDITDGSTAHKCAPPIRGAEHRERLWEGLIDGQLAMVVSDHSPAPAELKEIESGDFARAWGGIGSVQLRLNAVWTGAADRGIGWDEMSRWLALEPARLAGLDDRKGSIAVGKDADFVVFDPDSSLTVTAADLLHRHPVTPYDGMTLRGAVVATYLRGQRIYDGSHILTGSGRMMKRHD